MHSEVPANASQALTPDTDSFMAHSLVSLQLCLYSDAAWIQVKVASTWGCADNQQSGSDRHPVMSGIPLLGPILFSFLISEKEIEDTLSKFADDIKPSSAVDSGKGLPSRRTLTS